MFIILNYFKIVSKRLEELSILQFISEKNENFKNLIIKSLSQGDNQIEFQTKIKNDYEMLLEEIKNSNIQLITNKKNDEEILELLDDLILEFNEQNNLKKLESLEKKIDK